MAALLSLPDELLAIICSPISVETLVSLASTCRSLHHRLALIPSLFERRSVLPGGSAWRFLCKRDFGTIDDCDAPRNVTMNIIHAPVPECESLETESDWRACYRRTRAFIHKPAGIPRTGTGRTLEINMGGSVWRAWNMTVFPGEDAAANKKQEKSVARAIQVESEWVDDLGEALGQRCILPAAQAHRVLELFSADDGMGCALAIVGRPVLLDYEDQAGSIGRYYATFHPRDTAALHEHLACLQTMASAGALDPERPLARQLWPLLRLFSPGALVVRYVPAVPAEFIHFNPPDDARDATNPFNSYYPDSGTPVHETQPRSALNGDRVREYMQRISEGARPFLLLGCEPESSVAVVLDGHHKLIAYHRLGLPPPAVLIYPAQDDDDHDDHGDTAVNNTRALSFFDGFPALERVRLDFQSKLCG